MDDYEIDQLRKRYIGKHSLPAVLAALAQICFEKAEDETEGWRVIQANGSGEIIDAAIAKMKSQRLQVW